MKKTVLVFGTFDYLHPGHCDFFQQARKLGKVVAVVARDANVKRLKRKLPHKNERSRLASVVSDPNISHARLGDRVNLLQPIFDIKPDIIALGFDQKTFSLNKLQSELKKYSLKPKIIRLKSFQSHKYKSSLLRR